MKEQQILKEYLGRINKVIDYIEVNIGVQFKLEELASVACFSKFHFIRIFQGVTGETPFQFILRLRLEKAACMLLTDKGENITNIAYHSGFSDCSVFSRNFKNLFNCSPTQFRITNNQNSNISQIQSNSRQIKEKIYAYFCDEEFDDSQITYRRKNMIKNQSVEVKELPSITVAYVRHIGPYKNNEALFEKLFNKIMTWAGPRGFLTDPNFKSYIVYHDDPSITPEEKYRISVAIPVPEDAKVDGEIGKMDIEAGKYVVARFELEVGEYEEAWRWVFSEWLPKSGYQCDNKPCFEIYPEAPKNNKFIVDICVPIKPL